MSLPIDRLIRKSVVARDFRGVTGRHLSTLIERREWPAPDIKATKLGEADYYYESTAIKAREEWLRSRGVDAERTAASSSPAQSAQRVREEIEKTKPATAEQHHGDARRRRSARRRHVNVARRADLYARQQRGR